MTDREYNLKGNQEFPQVEPEASYWSRCPVPSTVPIQAIRDALDSKVKPYPPRESKEAQQELQELRDLYNSREVNSPKDPHALSQDQLSVFLKDPKYIVREPGPTVLNGPPAGAVLNRRSDHLPIIKNGGELARLFEAETPGLWHRHVLNIFLNPDTEAGKKLSPPRQALIWAVLDVTIASALMAAWHYKWLATDLDRVARRIRPVEADLELLVLYDFNIKFDKEGNILTGDLKDGARPKPSPGTPRHPAYPSGHSTYSAAASYVLGCLFPSHQEDFKKLANNIGEARLWGGVHWRSDHEAGQLIGETVGRLVIEQLNRSGIIVCPEGLIDPPERQSLEEKAEIFAKDCGQGTQNFCSGKTPALEDSGFQGTQG